MKITSIPMLKNDVVKVKGMKKKASSVSLVILAACKMAFLLSRMAIDDIKA